VGLGGLFWNLHPTLAVWLLPDSTHPRYINGFVFLLERVHWHAGMA